MYQLSISQAITEPKFNQHLQLLQDNPQYLVDLENFSAISAISFRTLFTLLITHGPMIFDILTKLKSGVTLEVLQSLVSQYGEVIWTILTQLFGGGATPASSGGTVTTSQG